MYKTYRKFGLFFFPILRVKNSHNSLSSCIFVNSVANSTCYGSGKDTDQQGTIPVHPISIGGKQGVGAGPLTNLNIGMDYWSGGAPSVLANGRGHRVPSSTIIPSGVSGDLWPQVLFDVPLLRDH